MAAVGKGEGFSGQRIVVLPQSVVRQAQRHPLLATAFPTDIGYFPRARGHWRQRPEGAEQAIFLYCVKGAGWCEIAGKRHTVQAGELLVIPPRTPHTYAADEDRPWTLLWFHVQGSQTRAFLQALAVSAERPTRSIGESAEVAALFEEILSVVEQGYSLPHLIRASHALAHLLALLAGPPGASRHAPAGPRQKVERTILYMRQHLNKSLHLDALAATANLARSQYIAQFKQLTGYAPIDYFIRLKMHRACQLLDTTDLSVKAIAAALGYDDQLYFSRQFKMVNDIPPRAYRALRKG